MICLRFLPRTILLGQWSMGARLEPQEVVSLEPLLFFLAFLLENLIHLLSMCLAQFLELLVPPSRGRGQMTLPPMRLLLRSLVLRVLAQVLKP
jgi:hypothetical protein